MNNTKFDPNNIFSLQNDSGNISSSTNDDFTKYEARYMRDVLDIILQKSRRKRTIYENKIYDYIKIDLDSNVKRQEKQLNEFFNSLTISEISSQSIISTMHTIRVKEFIPKNLMNFIYIMDSSVQSGVDIFENFDKNNIFSFLEKSVVSDLIEQYSNNTINASDISLISNIISNKPITKNKILNTAIRDFIDYSIERVLPANLFVFFDYVQFDNLLYGTFENDTEKKESFKQDVENVTNIYYKERKIKDYISNQYQNNEYYIDFNDIQGINIRSGILSELQVELYNETKNYLLNNNIIDLKEKYELNDNSSIIDYIVGNIVDNIIAKIINSKIGLPSLGLSIQAIVTETKIATKNSFLRGINTFVNSNLLPKQYIKEPANRSESYIDYLVNIKRSIENRIDFNNNKIDNQIRKEIDEYLKLVLVNPNDIQNENKMRKILEELDNNIN